MKTWKEYYLECKDIYNKETKLDNSSINVYDLKLQLNPFPKDQLYIDQINFIQNKLDILYQDKTNYRNRYGLALGLNDIFIFEKEIKIILENHLISYLEKNIFGCYIQCQNIMIYKTISEQSEEVSSWLWHIDNNPKEQIKVMIYLNDVYDNGPFKYLSKDNKALKCIPETHRQDYNHWRPNNMYKQIVFEKFNKKWMGSRLPSDIIYRFTKTYNCKETELKGPAGTTILFDNNIIHKGTIPSKKFRYAMILQFQPSNKKLHPVLSKENTGNGWNTILFTQNPESPIQQK